MGETMKLNTAVIAVVLLCFSPFVQAETLDNNAIISLSHAGLSDGLIIDKINSVACNYDVSVDRILELKRVGLSESVIGAMVRRCATLGQQRGLAGDDSSSDPKVRHSPGIYAMENWTTPAKLQILRPSKASGVRSSGNGSIAFPMKTILVMRGATGHVQIQDTTPEFYFYFNPSDEKVSDFGMENSMAAQSPDEFSAIRFKPKGSDREVVIGKFSAYGNVAVGVRRGIDPKYIIPFQALEVSSGVFKVSFDKPLAAGEYAFVFTGGAENTRIYDFSVSETGSATVHSGSADALPSSMSSTAAISGKN